MLSEIIWSINPINWNVSSVSEAFQPELILLLFLVFTVMLIDLANIKFSFITPYFASSIVVAAFFIIRYNGSGILAYILPLIYIAFTLVKDRAVFLENKMYELPSKSRRERRKLENDDQPPIVVRIVMLFIYSCWVVLTVLPFNYLLLALEQFESYPNLIITYLGIVLMIYAIISLVGCMTQISKQNEADEEADNKAGYISTGKFKNTQSPVQFYQMFFFFSVVVCGIVFYFGIIQWFMVLLGYLITRKIMLNKAESLEEHRRSLLEGDTAYKRYNFKTAIFNPFFPKTTLLKSKAQQKPISKTTSADESSEEEKEEKDGKKKRPEKKERPKKERPKKEKKEKKKEE